MSEPFQPPPTGNLPWLRGWVLGPAAATVLVVGLLIGLASAQDDGTPRASDPAEQPSPTGPQAWIDAPLDGSTIALAPYEVVAHAGSPVGVASFELTVNGGDPIAVEPTEPGGTLASMTTVWTPPAPGSFVLAVQATDGDGNQGPTAQVTVMVGTDEPGTDSTTSSTTTTTTSTTTTSTTTSGPSTTTSTTVTTSTTIPGPTTTVSGDTTGPTLVRVTATPTLFFQGGSCTPTSTRITVLTTDPSGVAGVDLFYRMIVPTVDPDPAFVKVAMPLLSGDTYRTWLDAADMTAIPIRSITGTLEFYVVARDTVGNKTTSPTDDSVSMKKC